MYMAFEKGNIPWNKDIKYTESQKSKLNLDGLSFGHQTGKKHHLWKGEKASYSAIHYWVYRQLGKAIKCANCGNTKKCAWANISGQYKRLVSDYKSLCYSCHAYFDDIGAKSWKARRGVVTY